MVITWDEYAISEMEHIAYYIEDTFNIKTARKFVGEVKHLTSLLANSPDMGKLEPLLADIPDGNIRSITVNKLCKLVYRQVDNDNLYIIALWDTRRAPDTLVNETRRRT